MRIFDLKAMLNPRNNAYEKVHNAIIVYAISLDNKTNVNS